MDGSSVRLMFSLDAGVAHLNHGSTGAVPLVVQRAQQRLREEMEGNPARFFGVGLEDRIAHVRRHLAAFLGADPDGAALVENATTGIAVVLDSVDLRAGDEIVTTDHGYGAVTAAVEEVCRRQGTVHRVARLPLTPSDETVVAAVRAAVTARTRLVIVDAVTSPTARLLPVRAVVEAVRDTGAAVLVDAAHAPGLIDEPVAWAGADFWVGNLHKWTFAPRGTAVLAVAPAWRERIRPLVVSWQQGTGFPGAVEWSGIRDYTPWLAAPVGLFALRTLGLDAVRANNAHLAAYGQRLVSTALGVDAPATGGLPMAVVPLPHGVAGDLASAYTLRRRIADELGAEVALNPWRSQGLLRLSAQVYNRPEEYEQLAERLPTLLAEHRRTAA